MEREAYSEVVEGLLLGLELLLGVLEVLLVALGLALGSLELLLDTGLRSNTHTTTTKMKRPN